MSKKNITLIFYKHLPNKYPREIEEKLLVKFQEQVSDVTKNKLYDPSMPIPFANLEISKGNRKRHGISKSKLA
jgi:hypothetical protein